jgi:hypothetical protein
VVSSEVSRAMCVTGVDRGGDGASRDIDSWVKSLLSSVAGHLLTMRNGALC